MKYCESTITSTTASSSTIQWVVRIETPGSYQVGLGCNSDKKFVLSLSVDGKLVYTFTHSANKCTVHLSSSTSHVFELTGFDDDEQQVKWIDVRLSYPDCGGKQQALLLKSGQSLDRDYDFPNSSPSGQYSVSFRRETGDIMISKAKEDGGGPPVDVVWKATWNKHGAGPYKLAMQGDGNLLLRGASSKTVWKTLTQGNPGAYLVLNDSGQLVVVEAGCCRSPLYIDGLSGPQDYGEMKRQCDKDENHYCLLLPRRQDEASAREAITDKKHVRQHPTQPIRGIFYYPWYPTTWSVVDNNKKHVAHWIPKLGKYDSGHLSTIENHVQQLQYANVQLAISSWWGPDHKSDRARLLTSMDVSWNLTRGQLKWCVYFEPQHDDDTVAGLCEKLQYLKQWFTNHPSWLHSDGKPVIFVYNLKSDCTTSQRWMTAANGEWHVVLKWFSGWKECQYQPSGGWHQYGPSTQWHHGKNMFVNISPGFWQARDVKPRLERVTKTEWFKSVQKMVSVRNVRWHLITSFNEACEGTLIEATDEWDSDSGMGYFLDALHEHTVVLP